MRLMERETNLKSRRRACSVRDHWWNCWCTQPLWRKERWMARVWKLETLRCFKYMRVRVLFVSFYIIWGRATTLN